jgi:hypothetical protein
MNSKSKKIIVRVGFLRCTNTLITRVDCSHAVLGPVCQGVCNRDDCCSGHEGCQIHLKSSDCILS